MHYQRVGYPLARLTLQRKEMYRNSLRICNAFKARTGEKPLIRTTIYPAGDLQATAALMPII